MLGRQTVACVPTRESTPMPSLKLRCPKCSGRLFLEECDLGRFAEGVIIGLRADHRA